MKDGVNYSVSPAPTRHIVWDWNGTLTDDVDRFVTSLNRMLQRRRLRTVDREAYRDEFDFPVRQYYRRLGFNLDSEDWNALSLEFHDGFLNVPDPGIRPEARSLLGRLQSAGLPMSVLSALEQSRLDRVIDEAGLRPFFRHVHGAGDLNAHSKFDAGQALAGCLNLPPESVCLIGDTTHDFEVALRLGWRSVLVATGHHSRRRLTALGACVVDDLTQAEALLLAVEQVG